MTKCRLPRPHFPNKPLYRDHHGSAASVSWTLMSPFWRYEAEVRSLDTRGILTGLATSVRPLRHDYCCCFLLSSYQKGWGGGLSSFCGWKCPSPDQQPTGAPSAYKRASVACARGFRPPQRLRQAAHATGAGKTHCTRDRRPWLHFSASPPLTVLLAQAPTKGRQLHAWGDSTTTPKASGTIHPLHNTRDWSRQDTLHTRQGTLASLLGVSTSDVLLGTRDLKW